MNGFGTSILEKLGIKNTDITKVLKPGQLEPVSPDEAVTLLVDGALARNGIKKKSAEGAVVEETSQQRADRVLNQLQSKPIVGFGTANRVATEVDPRHQQLQESRKKQS